MDDQIQFLEERPDHSFRTELPHCVDDADLECDELRVYMKIKRIAGDGGSCFQSVKTLAASCKLSERKTIDVISKLCEVNKILGVPLLKKIERKKPDGSRDTNIYYIVDVWNLNKKYKQKTPKNDGGGVVQNLHQGGAQFAYKEEPIKNIKNRYASARETSEPIVEKVFEKIDSKNTEQKIDLANKPKSQAVIDYENAKKNSPYKSPAKENKPIPFCLQKMPWNQADKQIIANQGFSELVLVEAMKEMKSHCEKFGKADNAPAFFTAKAKNIRDKMQEQKYKKP